VCRLTGAGPDTQSRYLVQVERLAGWLREIERSSVLRVLSPTCILNPPTTGEHLSHV
jgi:hypothetical protein